MVVDVIINVNKTICIWHTEHKHQLLSLLRSLPFLKGLALYLKVSLGDLVASAIALDSGEARTVYDSERLGVLAELRNIRIFIHPPSLPLQSKTFLKRVL